MIKQDKLLHFFYGNLIGFTLINSLRNVLEIYWIFLILAIGFLLYEVYQKVFKKGTFELWDWFFGVLGAFTIFITAL